MLYWLLFIKPILDAGGSQNGFDGFASVECVSRQLHEEMSSDVNPDNCGTTALSKPRKSKGERADQTTTKDLFTSKTTTTPTE